MSRKYSSVLKPINLGGGAVAYTLMHTRGKKAGKYSPFLHNHTSRVMEDPIMFEKIRHRRAVGLNKGVYNREHLKQWFSSQKKSGQPRTVPHSRRQLSLAEVAAIHRVPPRHSRAGYRV